MRRRTSAYTPTVTSNDTITAAKVVEGRPTTLVHVRVFGSGWPGAGSIKVLMQSDVGQSRTAVTAPATKAAAADLAVEFMAGWCHYLVGGRTSEQSTRLRPPG